MRVYDTWWPHRHGTIIRARKTRTVVQWDDGSVWVYDRAHSRHFLREVE